MPGIGPNLAVGIMLPFCFQLNAVYGITFLVAINVACSFGNSIPAILMGVPGTSSAVITAIDGYALHKKGKSGLALGVTFFSSVFGQFLSTFYFLAMVVPLAGLTYIFLTPELFALYFLGVTAIISVTGTNLLKGLVASAFGLFLSLVGSDPINSVDRYIYHMELYAGLQVVPVSMGLLAVSELFRSMRQSFSWDIDSKTVKAKFPSAKELWRVMPNIMVGTAIGTIVGAIPGTGGTASAVISYQQSKLWSKHPEEYGKGSIEGVAANEAAQNASQAGELVPTLGLGIPGSSTMVFLFGAMLMKGIVPGPQMLAKTPELLYACGAGCFAATFMLAIIGWPMSLSMLKLINLDRQLIFIGALGLCIVGVFSLNNSVFDVFLMLLFGMVGYFMRRYGYSVAGTSLALILGTGLESNLRGGLLLAGGWWHLLTRPWVMVILGVAFALLFYAAWGTIKMARRDAAIRRRSIERARASASN